MRVWVIWIDDQDEISKRPFEKQILAEKFLNGLLEEGFCAWLGH
jgi:hypothetical protein